MIGNKLEQSIINVFQNDLSSTFSINQVSKILNKSYPLINKKSNFFLKEGVLKKINVGKSYQCFLNMTDDNTKVLMAVNEINKKEAYVQKYNNSNVLIDELSQLSKKFNIETIMLYKKTLIFITQDTSKKNEIMDLSVLTKDYTFLFFNKKSFQEYFMQNKDLQKYHLVLFNVDIWVNIITEVADTLLVNGLINGGNGCKTDSHDAGRNSKQKVKQNSKLK
jgi:hypothetical protein